MSVTWNGGASAVSTSGNLQLERWVDLNLIARWNDIDATMDITFHIGEFELGFTLSGNPFHHKKDTDIVFCKNCHAFILNAVFFNQPLQLPEIEGLRFEPNFPFDFSLPTCLFGQFFENDRCTDCDGCLVCAESATNCVEACFDLECSSCDDSSEGAACHDCSGNGLA
jgi:hypothetical protein